MNYELENLVIDGEETFDFIQKALSYMNVLDLEFRNCDFINEDILKLIEFKSYERIAFMDCTFENVDLIEMIRAKSLSLINNKIVNYDFIYEMNCLERLTVVGGMIDIFKINNLKNIEYLRMSNSDINNIDKLNLDKLKYLFIDNTNVIDISFIKKIPNLELLSISENQIECNRELLNTIKNNIKIVLDGVVEMEVHFDE